MSNIDKHRLVHLAPIAIDAHQIGGGSTAGTVTFHGYKVRRSPLKENAIAVWWNIEIEGGA